MALININDFRPLANAHYGTNLILAILYFILKYTPKVCDVLFNTCQLEMREWEWLTFMACVVVLKNRKTPTVSEYVSTACLFVKTLSVICFFNYNPAYGILYILLCIGHVLFFPKPVYQGPESILYFRGPNLCEELERNKRVTWLITFYAAWSPKCVNFAPVFSELSHDYTLENLKFGKMDISKYPIVADKYKINIGPLSRQLPTIILFQDGKEIERRPVPTKHVTLKFDFTKVNVIKEFQLNEVYNQCKKALSSRNKVTNSGDAGDTKKDK
uniref:Thioredoxin domain-containing protein n=1 Tax=Arion vulgaris TaxID=1028688 RepID=A0A0B6ZLZ9_9EUPU